MKPPTSEAVPPIVVTATSTAPLATPAGTVAVNDVALLYVTDAETPPKVTVDAAVKFVPVKPTEAPRIPDVGLNEAKVGAATIVNVLSLFDTPPCVVNTTAFAPDKPFGTVTVTDVALLAVTVADVPPTVTVGVNEPAFKPVPARTIESPALPDAAVTLEIDGDA